MQLIKRVGEGFLLAALIFLLFILIFQQSVHLPLWLQVVGRMHPMFLHFPIVLLLLYLFALWLPSMDEKWLRLLGLVAAISSVVTAIMGLILSLEELREGDVFFLHKWGGILIAIIATSIYYLHYFFVRRKIVTRPLTLAAGMLVFFTGHWGADLTHGDNYLLEPLASEKKKTSLDKAYAFDDVIQPLLQEKCGTCHNASSKKGGLSIEDTSSILEGGKTGPLFTPNNPDSSLIMFRILLPLNEKKHMAPKNKPQLTEEEIQLLRIWINAGAPLHKKIIELPTTDSFRLVAASYLSPAENGETAYGFPAADESKIKSLNNNYREVAPLDKNSPALIVHFYGKDGYSEKALEELLQVKQQIIELSLARLPVKDEDLKYVQQLPNLEKLNLNYTDVTDKGIEKLTALKNLNALALSGTAISYTALQKLMTLPLLSELFVWNIKLDSAQIASLSQQKPSIKIETGYIAEKDTTTYTLNPPTIKTAEGIFEGSTLLEVKHGIRGVEIRYTLDGTDPDSIKSAVYKEPISLDSSVTLKVKAYKDEWHSSGIAERIFLKKGIPIDSIELLSQADSALNPDNSKILHDNNLGKVTNYQNNKWFGYKKNDAVYLLSFKQPIMLNQLWVVQLKNPGANLFPAQSIEVWGGTDKNNMKLLSKVLPVQPKNYDPAAFFHSRLSFASSSLRYMKVVIRPVKKIPKWHFGKGKPAYVLVSELIVN